MTEPKGYDMTKFEDMTRWFIEMEGYLKRCNNGQGFVSEGTDLPGRRYAMDAFIQLKRNFAAALPLMGMDVTKLKKKYE